MQARSEAREFCFLFLFHLGLPIFKEDIEKLKTLSNEEWKKEFGDFAQSSDDITCPDSERDFALKLSMKTLENLEMIKEKIATTAKNWRLDRMARVDYTILLMASSEGLIIEETNKKIIINEAIELAKKYGSADSGKFINGVLDKVLG